MADYKVFPDIIGEVVSNIRSTYDTENGVYPMYEYGTYLELSKENALKDRIRTKGFPLVWLVWGDGNNKESWVNGGNYKVSPRIFIIAESKPNYKSEQRESLVFNPVLYPILDSLIKHMGYSEFMMPYEVDVHEKTNHYLFGVGLDSGKVKNMFNYYLDAIELNFKELEIQKNC